MKRQLSLLMLLSRSQLYRVLAILAAMAAVQLAVAWWGIGHLNDTTGYNVEQVLDGSLFRWPAAVAMMAIFACFGALGRRGGRVDYTWYRLPVSDGARDVWPLVAGVLLFFLVWAVQLAVVMGVMVMYSRMMPERVHQQTLFLASYVSAYFHGLLPLDDVWRWVATAFRYVGLGLYGGMAMLRSMRGKRTIHPFISIIAMTLIVSPLGSYDWDVIILATLWIMLFLSASQLPQRAEEEREEETP